MDTIILVWVGLFGLTVGSFLNVVIYRLPLDKGLVSGRSMCPQCGTQLKWYHNVPLISFAVLRGRCGFCGKVISWRYPLVEALTAAAFVYFYWYLGFSPAFFVWIVFISALIAIFFIDLDHQIIPDSITLPGMALGVGVSFAPGGIGIASALTGLLVGGGSLFLVAVLGEFLFKKEAMGGGDVKMAAMLGAFLGWQKVLLVFLSSAVIGLVVSLAVMSVSAKLRESRMIPFGPFLAIAAVISALYGDRIIDYYLSHFIGMN